MLRLLLYSLLLSGLFAETPVFAQAPGEIRVEGIVYDKAEPDNSMVIIGDDYLQQGQVVAGFEILEIKRESVVLKDSETGEIQELGIKEAPRVIAPDTPVAAMTPEEPRTWQEMFQEFVDGIFAPKRKPEKMPAYSMTGSKDLGNVWTRRAVLDLQELYKSAFVYYQETGKRPQNLTELIQAKYLDEKFSSGVRGKYRYSFSQNFNDPGFHADPVDTSEGLVFLFVDAELVIHEQKGRRADSTSPRHKSHLQPA